MLLHNVVQAYHNGKYYPNYAWILLGHHETDWWREYYMETNCSDTDMMKVLNRSLILIPYPEFYNTIKVYIYIIVYKQIASSIIVLFALYLYDNKKALPWIWPLPGVWIRLAMGWSIWKIKWFRQRCEFLDEAISSISYTNGSTESCLYKYLYTCVWLCVS